MDAYSSGEDLLIKTRKPYTITKQRERWTEEEHNRFLEALKLYGRAWQRIEEHIGTKTAVQIRSHAQKFFSKLEKEALVKGVPIGQAIDIEIPPPRPKRKPSNPYPRKTGAVSSPNIQVREKDGKQLPPGSSHSEKHVDMEKEPLAEKHVGDDVEPKSKEACGDDQCSQAFTLFHEAPSSLEASSNENSATALEASRKLSNFKEFVPVKKSSINDERTDVHAADGPNRNHQPDKLDAMEMVQNDASNQMHAAKIFPRHAPIQILDGSLGTCSQGLSSDVSYQEPTFHHHPALFSNPVVNPAVSATVESGNSASRPTNHHVYPSFHSPCHPFPNIPEDYSSFLQMSSTFSTLIVSALLQNPAAHAAASYAASFWPSSNVESSAHSPAGLNGGIASRPMNPSPSMAAIAAATVAAATAWWAAHGLLPLCAPLHAGFPFPPASISTPFANVGPTSAANEEREENNIQNPCSQVQQADQELSEARQPQNSPSKSSTTSSSDSGNSCGEKLDIGAAAACTEKKVPATIDQNDLCKGKSKKQVDRSSCGSNTPSGSDVETDALGKDDKEKEEPKEPDVNHSTNELSSRRNRIPSGMNDTWKEVSQGGRLAFQALFSRERLPQSFSPTNNVSSKEQEMNDVEKHRPNADGRNEEASQFDLNSSTWESVSFDKGIEKNGLRDEDNGKDGLLTISLSQGKLKSQRTGFKPYKRCSVEARDNRMGNSSTQEQENCPKRLRLQGEAST